MEAQDSSVSGSTNSVPSLPPDSPGSSVSTRMQEEYDELLKYAVVVPNIEANAYPAPTQHDVMFPGAVVQDDQGTNQEPNPNPNQNQNAVGDENEREEHEERAQQESRSSQSTPTLSESSSDVRNVRFYDAIHSREVDKFLATQRFTTPLLSDTDSIAQLKSQQQQQYEQVSNNNNGNIVGGELDDGSGSVTGGFSPGIDPDIARMETLLDQWLGDVKRNVLAEFSHSRIRQMEASREHMQREREKHAGEMMSLGNELESLKELLHTYEQSIQRKDDVISNLTGAMGKQRDKFDTLKTFCEWKIKHNDVKREGFAGNLAVKHYEHALQRKAWDAWRSLIENKWKQRVEKACQGKAQEVCMQLTNDYETQIKSLNEALTSSRNEISRLHAERERYEDTMKKAFMRGVCALNMEAMSMFHSVDQATDVHPDDGMEAHTGGGAGPSQGPGLHPVHFMAEQVPVPDHLGAPVSIPQEAMFTTEPPGAPAPRVVTSQSTTRTSQQSSSTAKAGLKGKSSRGGKLLHTKITASRTDSGRVASGGGTLAPPMSSVMVERHQPVTKQTIGHATAMRYPKQQSSIVQRKVAGQAGAVGHPGSVHLVSSNIQTVKVVE